MKWAAQSWRTAAGIGVLLLLALMAVLLVPPYYENWKLQGYIDELAGDPASAAKPPDTLRANIVNKAASLGLPVRGGDVRVNTAGGALRIEILYVVRVELPVYTVDLHFRPKA
jgi:hypothetical protein